MQRHAGCLPFKKVHTGLNLPVVISEWFQQVFRQQCKAVFAPFACHHFYLKRLAINIAEPDMAQLIHAQAGAVKQRNNHAVF